MGELDRKTLSSPAGSGRGAKEHPILSRVESVPVVRKVGTGFSCDPLTGSPACIHRCRAFLLGTVIMMG